MTPRHYQAAVRCTDNIAQHWMWEHREYVPGVLFPGDTAFPQSLMPVAIWLGTREFAGVWTHGSRPRFGTDEIFGFLGDGQLVVLADAMAIYGLEPSPGVAWSPGWYRDNFVHWALHYVRLPSSTINSIVWERSRPSQELTWCGVADCPYPYVTVGSVRLSSPAEIEVGTRKAIPPLALESPARAQRALGCE